MRSTRPLSFRLAAGTTYLNGYTNQIASATSEQFLLMLYDGAIRCTTLAVKAIDSNDIPRRAYYLNPALRK
ncbi:MAG TPA: hypothetical protein ENJ30_04835 [Desulfobulbaceae bacterium]|nr:hypothetical protein [Desulfobulbaceae bacterium]